VFVALSIPDSRAARIATIAQGGGLSKGMASNTRRLRTCPLRSLHDHRGLVALWGRKSPQISDISRTAPSLRLGADFPYH
jgi:hypothetical protein